VAHALRSLQLRTLVWYGITGVLGFLVDAGVLHLMVSGWNTNLFLARGCSFTSAATTTWMINRILTFSPTHRQPRQLLAEWAAYFAASLGGGCLNYLVFAIAVRVSPSLHQIPSIAVALGTLAGTTFNFLMYAQYVFPHRAGASRLRSKRDSRG
jgi:putative flippase GtrA